MPGGLAGDCTLNTSLSSACVCGGSVVDTGYCCEMGYSFSACSTRDLYVRPGGSGAQDGSDWSNALNGLPGTLQRDTVYWLAAGNYGSYTFDDGASGSDGITLRKATSQEHGTDTGWSASYGSGQAVFGPLDFRSDRYTLDGGEPNGIRTVGEWGTTATVRAAGDYLVLRHVEIDGGLRTSGSTQTAGGCNGANVSGQYIVLDRCDLHNIADDGLEIHSADHVKVLYSKIHGLQACGTDSSCSGPCFNGHSDGIELSNTTDIELIGNMVYDVHSTAAIFMDNYSGTKIYDLVAYNNVFYTPHTAFAVYLHRLDGAKFHNNIVWGRTQGDRYGGLAMGQDVTNLEMYNNIILNVNYSHMGSTQNPSQHDLDYNLFGMIASGEYRASTNDVIANPDFAGIPLSGSLGDHKGSNVRLEDFIPGASEAIDTGTTAGSVPAYDIAGEERPQGSAPDRGVFEVIP